MPDAIARERCRQCWWHRRERDVVQLNVLLRSHPIDRQHRTNQFHRIAQSSPFRNAAQAAKAGAADDVVQNRFCLISRMMSGRDQRCSVLLELSSAEMSYRAVRAASSRLPREARSKLACLTFRKHRWHVERLTGRSDKIRVLRPALPRSP